MFGRGPWAFPPGPVSQETLLTPASAPRKPFRGTERQHALLAFYDAIIDQIEAGLAERAATRER